MKIPSPRKTPLARRAILCKKRVLLRKKRRANALFTAMSGAPGAAAGAPAPGGNDDGKRARGKEWRAQEVAAWGAARLAANGLQQKMFLQARLEYAQEQYPAHLDKVMEEQGTKYPWDEGKGRNKYTIDDSKANRIALIKPVGGKKNKKLSSPAISFYAIPANNSLKVDL